MNKSPKHTKTTTPRPVIRFLVAGSWQDDPNIQVTRLTKQGPTRDQLVAGSTHTLGEMRKILTSVPGQWILIQRSDLYRSFGCEFVYSDASYEIFARYHEGFSKVDHYV